jgi:hypothetical protein
MAAAGLFPASSCGDEAEAAEAIRKAKGYIAVPPVGKYDVVICNPATDIDAVMKQLKYLPALNTVASPHFPADQYMDVLAAIPRLKSLAIALTTDMGMKQLGAMKNLEKLELATANVSNTGFANLAMLTELKELALASGASDQDLVHLSKLVKIEVLRLHDNKITDAGMKHVSGLKQVRRLLLGLTAVGDAGLKELAGLTEVRELLLYATPVTDEGCKVIAGFTQLTILRLDGTKFTDAGVKHLTNLNALEELDLSRTGLTDAGLLELAGGCKKLRLLRIAKTQVTPMGKQEFRKLHGGVAILG